MTVIAYDGKVIAMDRMMTRGDTVHSGSKWRIAQDGSVLTGCGGEGAIGMLMDWYDEGCQKEKWPVKKEDGTVLVVASADRVGYFDPAHPAYIPVEDPYFAWGTGREVALGALFMKASAFDACIAAGRHCVGCGRGVDTFRLSDYVRRTQ